MAEPAPQRAGAGPANCASSLAQVELHAGVAPCGLKQALLNSGWSFHWHTEGVAEFWL